MSPPGLEVTRKLSVVCNREFEIEIAIRKENEVGWNHPDFISSWQIPSVINFLFLSNVKRDRK